MAGAWEPSGSGGELQKLTIKKADANGQPTDADKFECQFNPQEFTIVKKNSFKRDPRAGENAPAMAFNGGDGRTVDLSLTFDTTDTGTSVRTKYEKLLKLMEIANIDSETKLGEPPWVFVQWGTTIPGFPAVVKQISEKFKMFLANGTPVRAEVTVSLMESAESAMGPQNPTSRSEARKTWIVEQGQRLDWIAHQEYGESSAWRQIADANSILDPKQLFAGQVLKLASLKREQPTSI